MNELIEKFELISASWNGLLFNPREGSWQSVRHKNHRGAYLEYFDDNLGTSLYKGYVFKKNIHGETVLYQNVK